MSPQTSLEGEAVANSLGSHILEGEEPTENMKVIEGKVTEGNPSDENKVPVASGEVAVGVKVQAK